MSINKVLNLTKVNVPTHLPNEYGPNVQYIQVYTFNNIHIYIYTYNIPHHRIISGHPTSRSGHRNIPTSYSS